jgi:hypothetical protein
MSARGRWLETRGSYLPARRCQRVAFNIFLCFFFRIRLRRFLMSDPMSSGRLAGCRSGRQVAPPPPDDRPALAVGR